MAWDFQFGTLCKQNKSTKHPFQAFFRPYVTPRVDPKQRLLLMDKNPSLTAAFDPLCPHSAKLQETPHGSAGRIVASRHVIYSYLPLIPSVVLPFTFLAYVITPQIQPCLP
jgi:hypothetical protein